VSAIRSEAAWVALLLVLLVPVGVHLAGHRSTTTGGGPSTALEGAAALDSILAASLLNFWATWCPPCEAEMPDLDALYRTYGESQGLVVLGVNLQEDAGKITPFVRERNLGFPILLDTDGHVTS